MVFISHVSGGCLVVTACDSIEKDSEAVSTPDRKECWAWWAVSAPGRETDRVCAVDAGSVWVFLETRALFAWPFLQVEVIKKAYMQGEVEFEDGENGEDGAASPRNVGHNIYILAHQVWPSLAALQDIAYLKCQNSRLDVPSHLLFL